MHLPFRLLGIAGLGVAALLSLPATAAAAPANTTKAAALSGQPAFAAQARQAGLTSAQAAELQSQVNGYLASEGGTQVAANEVRLPSGAQLLLPLPGQRTARQLGPNAPAGGPCPFEDFCAYQFPNGGGAQLNAFFCGVDVHIPWVGVGSWINNQTPGTQGWFEDNFDNIIAFTGPALSAGTANWTPIHDIEAC